MEMRKVILIIFGLIGLNCFSQNSEEKTVERLEGMFLSDPLSVSHLVDSIEKTTSDSSFLSKLWYMKAKSLLVKGDVESTMILLDKVLRLSKENENWEYLANAYNIKAIAFDRLDQKTEAISNYRKTIHVGEYLEDKSVLIKGLNNIALSFIENNQLDSADLYIKRGISLTTKTSAPKDVFYFNMALTSLLLKQGKYQDVLDLEDQIDDVCLMILEV